MFVKTEQKINKLKAMPEWHDHEQLHPSVPPDP